MPAGYSGTPLIKKLGIKPAQRMVILNAPENYLVELGDLPPDTQINSQLGANLDMIHYFAKSEADLMRDFPDLKAALALDGMLWISWIKKSAKIPTDLDGNIVREIGLDQGLVDVKVCAINDIWSGLKFVYRKEDRS